jgi:hypothetical protein
MKEKRRVVDSATSVTEAAGTSHAWSQRSVQLAHMLKGAELQLRELVLCAGV